MSHELEFINGEAAFAFAGSRESIWHSLGTQVSPDLTPQEIMKAAKLDWDVVKVPLTGMYDDEEVSTGSSALLRTSDHSVLDVVPNSWNPVQNSEAFAFFDEFIDAGSMKMDTAGSIRNGRKVWALAKLNDGFELFGGDKIEGYLLFSNPHYFGRCVDIKFTTVRTVCNNTLSLALKEDTDNWVRHSHRTEFDVDRVKALLGIVSTTMDAFKQQAEVLGSKVYSNDNAIEYFQKIFPVLTTKRSSRKELSTQAARALEIVETQPGAGFRPGSYWNLLQAVTYITSNEYGRNDETRLDSLWYGANEQRNRRALKVAVQMAA